MEESEEDSRKRPRKNPTPRKRPRAMDYESEQPVIPETEIKQEPDEEAVQCDEKSQSTPEVSKKQKDDKSKSKTKGKDKSTKKSKSSKKGESPKESQTVEKDDGSAEKKKKKKGKKSKRSKDSADTTIADPNDGESAEGASSDVSLSKAEMRLKKKQEKERLKEEKRALKKKEKIEKKKAEKLQAIRKQRQEAKERRALEKQQKEESKKKRKLPLETDQPESKKTKTEDCDKASEKLETDAMDNPTSVESLSKVGTEVNMETAESQIDDGQDSLKKKDNSPTESSSTPLGCDNSAGEQRTLASESTNKEVLTEMPESPDTNSNSSSISTEKSKSSTKSSSRVSSKAPSRASSKPGSRTSSRPGSPDPNPSSHGIQGLEDIRLLTEQLGCLNRDSDHLNTVIYRKPTPRKRKKRLQCHQSTPLRGSPGLGRTPRKSPWKGFGRLTPRKTPLKTPRSASRSPGSVTSSCRSSPVSCGFSPASSKVVRRTPSKASIKRRLYAGMASPDNEDNKQGSSEQDTPIKRSDLPSSSLYPNDVYSPSLGDRLNINTDDDDDQWEDTLEDIPEEDTLLSSAGKEALASTSSFVIQGEDVIDQQLEEKSQKIKLTAKNVRSIIHQVITNEHVLDMVRNTLQAEDGLENQLKDAIFEEKMTRSKVKEAMEKGTVPLPWTLSPIKGLGRDPQRTEPAFLEMSFSDTEEQDEEYEPSPEEMERADDDDEESVCSQTSVAGSPRPPSVLSMAGSPRPGGPLSVAASPCPSVMSDIAADNIDTATDNADSTDSPLTPTAMGPPPTSDIPVRTKRLSSTDDKQKDPDVTIAERTRSKLPLNDKPLWELEADFVAPDITPDLYDTNCDLTEWKKFCLLTVMPKSGENDLDDTADDMEDPDFLADAEMCDDEDDDEENHRNDKAVRIPKKELNDLINELFETYGGADVLEDEDASSQVDSVAPSTAGDGPETVVTTETGTETITTDAGPIDGVGQAAISPMEVYESTSKETYANLPPLDLDPHLASVVAKTIIRAQQPELRSPDASGAPGEGGDGGGDDSTPGSLTGNRIPELTDSERTQLHDQMRKHVQLLAQTYVQAAASEHDVVRGKQIEARYLLMELNHLGDRMKSAKPSMFHPPNLPMAMALIQKGVPPPNPAARDILEKHIRCNVMTKKAFNQFGLTYEQMDTFATSPVFIIPQMLPEYMLVKAMERKMRVAFTDAEDNLLAMGIDQFHHMEGKRYELIHKHMLPTKERSQLRFRHKNLKARTIMNSIRYWYSNGQLPEFVRYTQLEDPADFKLPKDRDEDLLPKWFESYLKTKKELQLESVTNLAELVQLTLTESPVKAPSQAGTPSGSEVQGRGGNRRKPAPTPAKTDDEPLPIAPRPASVASPLTVLATAGDMIINSPATGPLVPGMPHSPSVLSYASTVPESPMERQVMEKLMSAMDAPTPMEAPTVDTAAINPGLIVESVTPEDGKEPRVVLTASQLKHLGINLDIFGNQQQQQALLVQNQQPVLPQNQPPVSAMTLDVVSQGQGIATSLPLMSSQSSVAVIESVDGLIPTTPSLNTTVTSSNKGGKSLISHAFCEATGIPMVDLANISQVLDGNNAVVSAAAGTPLTPIPAMQTQMVSAPALIDSSYPQVSIGTVAPTVVAAPVSVQGEVTMPSMQTQLVTEPALISSNYPQVSVRTVASSVVAAAPVSVQVEATIPTMHNQLVTESAPISSIYPQVNLETVAATVDVAPIPAQIEATLQTQIVSAPAPIDSNYPQVSIGTVAPSVVAAPVSVQVEPTIRAMQTPLVSEPASISSNYSQVTVGTVDPTAAATHVPVQIEATVPVPIIAAVEAPDAAPVHPVEPVQEQESPMETEDHQQVEHSGLPDQLDQQDAPLTLSDQLKSDGLDSMVPKTDTQITSISAESVSTESAEPSTELSTVADVTPELRTEEQTELTTEENANSSSEAGTEDLPPTDNGDTLPASITTVPQSNRDETVDTTPKPSAEESIESTPKASNDIKLNTEGDANLKTPPNNVTSETPPRPEVTVVDTPTKDAMKMMAQLAQMISPEAKMSPLKWPHQQRSGISLWTSPSKLPRKSPVKSPLRPLRPLGLVSDASPKKIVLPERAKPGRPPNSPRRKDLNQQARAIAPKGFVVRSFISPVKIAAANISARARIMKKGGPKPKAVRKLKSLMDPKSSFLDVHKESDGEGSCHLSADDEDLDEDLEDEAEASEDSQGEDDLRAGGEEGRLAALMAASTTVRGPPKKAALAEAKRSKLQKRDAALELLAPNLVENDNRRDERDTAFAQGYLLKVREVLSDTPHRYEQFLGLLYEFGCSEWTPMELYENIRSLLSDHPELVSDFAGFLMPDQAKVCGCFMENLGFLRTRRFLRKLEIYFAKAPGHLQRILRVFSAWQARPDQDPASLLATMRPLLRGQQHLLDEFTMFFENERPPDSLRTDFEEIVLSDSDSRGEAEYDGFEEVEFPDGHHDDDELLGTKLCRCRCHGNNSGEPKWAKRRLHCRLCCVRVLRGQVYIQTGERDVFQLVSSVPPPLDDDDVTINIDPALAADTKTSPGSEPVTSPEAILMDDASDEDEDEDVEDEEEDEVVVVASKARRKSRQLKVKLALRAAHSTPNKPGDLSTDDDDEDDKPVLLPSSPVTMDTVVGPTDFAGLLDKDGGLLLDSDSSAGSFTVGDDDSSDMDDEDEDLEMEDGEDYEDTEEEDEVEWNREEDRQILETCKRDGTDGETFERIAVALGGDKTANQVMSRFMEMMRLLTADEDAGTGPSDGEEDEE